MSEEFYNSCWYKDCPHYYICNKISNNRKAVCDILKSECDTHDEYPELHMKISLCIDEDNRGLYINDIYIGEMRL